MGWPESRVFWAKRTGASIGLAPYEASIAPINQPRTRKSKNLLSAGREMGGSHARCSLGNCKRASTIYDGLSNACGARHFIVTYCAAEGSTICSSRAWKPSAKLAPPLPKRASF